MNNVITIQPERRLCEVDGKLGYFHCWESYKDFFYGYVIGIVDDQNRELELLEKVHKKMKEATKHDVQRETD